MVYERLFSRCARGAYNRQHLASSLMGRIGRLVFLLPAASNLDSGTLLIPNEPV